MKDNMFYKEQSFKGTLIGNIPGDWEVVTLGDKNVAVLVMGQSPPSSTYNKEGVGLPFFQGKAEFGETYPSPTVYCSKPMKIAESNDVLLSVRAPVGDVNIASSKCCIGRGLSAIRAKSDKLYYLFLFHYLRFSSRRFEALSMGSTFKAIRKDEIENYKIPLPPLLEQQKIAKILNIVENAIQKVGEVIAKTESLKKGLMQELLARGIGHKEFKDTEIGKIPRAWQVMKLEEASKEITIGVVNPATPYYTNAKDGVPYFRTQNVKENRLEPTQIYVMKEFSERHSKSILKENDLLTVQTGFIGISCLVPKAYEGSNCHSLLITRADPELLNPQFLCHLLNSEFGKRIIMRHNSGWGRAHLLLQDLRKIRIPIPPLHEQKKIADMVSATYNKLRIEGDEKAKLDRIKVGLMDLLLTGRIRIKVN